MTEEEERELKNDVRALKQAVLGWPVGSDGLVKEIREFRSECNNGLKDLDEKNDKQHDEDRKSIRNLIFSILISGIAVVIAQLFTR